MPRCIGSKPDGSHCTRIVAGSSSYCYAHDPNRAEERRRHAKRGGRGKLTEPMKELRGLKNSSRTSPKRSSRAAGIRALPSW